MRHREQEHATANTTRDHAVTLRTASLRFTKKRRPRYLTFLRLSWAPLYLAHLTGRPAHLSYTHHVRGWHETAKWARRLLAPLGQASEEPPLDATIVKRVTAKRKDAELVAAGSPLGTCSTASSRDPRERVGTQTDSSSMPAVETWRRSRHRLRSARRSSSTGRHASVGMLRTAWTRTCWNRSRASTTLCVFVRGAGRARNPV